MSAVSIKVSKAFYDLIISTFGENSTGCNISSNILKEYCNGRGAFMLGNFGEFMEGKQDQWSLFNLFIKIKSHYPNTFVSVSEDQIKEILEFDEAKPTSAETNRMMEFVFGTLIKEFKKNEEERAKDKDIIKSLEEERAKDKDIIKSLEEEIQMYKSKIDSIRQQCI